MVVTSVAVLLVFAAFVMVAACAAVPAFAGLFERFPCDGPEFFALIFITCCHLVDRIGRFSFLFDMVTTFQIIVAEQSTI